MSTENVLLAMRYESECDLVVSIENEAVKDGHLTGPQVHPCSKTLETAVPLTKLRISRNQCFR